MNFIPSEPLILADPIARHLVDNLRSAVDEFDSDRAYFYHSFPLYKDSEGNNVLADALLISPDLGIVAFGLPKGGDDLANTLAYFEQVPAHIHSRLIRTKSLRSGLSNLIPPIHAVVVLFGDHAPDIPDNVDGIPVISTQENLHLFLASIRSTPLSETVYEQLLATIDGAKGLIRPSPRPQPPGAASPKAKIAYLVETAINDFDLHQKHGMYGAITGPTRIRGIAGSGKTVVLAMKAAITHLREPDAHILYTFWTKSLYQHVRRLITRFYRQFDDRDPDWNHIHILHGWGGKSTPGVYSNACQRLGIPSLTVNAASGPASLANCDPFDYACRQVESHPGLSPVYDYVLVDEAQDYPPSFLRMSYCLASKGRFVFAYDELQTIFQATAPTIESTFGAKDGKPRIDLTEDVILRKCYRNPREILVCSHAIGFGFYGPKVVQVLEDHEHWESVGYRVVSGDFTAGQPVVLERPAETSLTVVSENASLDEIVQVDVFPDVSAEVEFVCNSIRDDLKDGLKAEDILVIAADSHFAGRYLQEVQERLVKASIPANNLFVDTSSLKDFSLPNHVTLASVYKAKGNEAFMVYVLGVDGPMCNPDVRRRNILFTAMSRAKAWLRVTGVGEAAERFAEEIKKAKSHFPFLHFLQPSPGEIELVRRDIAESLDRKAKMQRVLSELLDLTEDGDEEVMELLKKNQKAGKRRRKKFENRSKE